MLVDRGSGRLKVGKWPPAGGETYIEALQSAAEVIREANDGVINQQ